MEKLSQKILKRHQGQGLKCAGPRFNNTKQSTEWGLKCMTFCYGFGSGKELWFRNTVWPVLGLVPDPWTSKAHSQRAPAHRCKVPVAAGLSSAARTTGPVNNWTGWYKEVLMDWLLLLLGQVWILQLCYSAHLCSRKGHDHFTHVRSKRGIWKRIWTTSREV